MDSTLYFHCHCCIGNNSKHFWLLISHVLHSSQENETSNLHICIGFHKNNDLVISGIYHIPTWTSYPTDCHYYFIVMPQGAGQA